MPTAGSVPQAGRAPRLSLTRFPRSPPPGRRRSRLRRTNPATDSLPRPRRAARMTRQLLFRAIGQVVLEVGPVPESDLGLDVQHRWERVVALRPGSRLENAHLPEVCDHLNGLIQTNA